MLTGHDFSKQYNTITLRWKRYLVMSLILLFLNACSTMQHHEIGDTYSGLSKVGERDKGSYGPNGAIGVGALFIPVIDGLYYVVYLPVDVVFTATADTLLYPIDLLMHESYIKHQAYKEAARNQDIDYAIKHYKLGEYKGKEPLISAVLNENNCSQVQKYIKGDIDRTDAFGYTALSYAIKDNRLACLSPLVKQSDLREFDFASLASKDINTSILPYLIEKGLDINVEDEQKSTPLIKAVKNANTKLLTSLLELGADVNVSDNRGFSPLMYAVETKNKAIFDQLMKAKTPVDISSEHGETALMLAIKKQEPDFAARLINEGADLNLKNDNGHDALRYSIVFNDKQSFDKLLKHKVDVDDKNFNGVTNLMISSNNDSIKENFYQDRGFDLKYSSDDYEIKRWGSLRSSFKNVKEYVLYENQYDMRYSDSVTYYSRAYFTRALLKAGADIHLKDKQGKNILFYAIHEDINGTASKTFLDQGIDINEEDANEESILMHLIREKTSFKAEKIKKALSLGANVNQGYYGYSPIDKACYIGDEEIVAVLIEGGAEISPEYATYNPILSCTKSSRGYYKNNYKAAKLLAKAGALQGYSNEVMQFLIDESHSFEVKRLIYSYMKKRPEEYDEVKEKEYLKCYKRYRNDNSYAGFESVQLREKCWKQVY